MLTSQGTDRSHGNETSAGVYLHDRRKAGHMMKEEQKRNIWLDGIMGVYTPFGEAFDVGGGTIEAITRYMRMKDPGPGTS